MKAINKNTITVLIIIFAGIFITSCDSCKPEPKLPNLRYLPDSLIFPFRTDDSLYYVSSINNDTIKFVITLDTGDFAPDYPPSISFYYQQEFLYLDNKNIHFSIEITKPNETLSFLLYYYDEISGIFCNSNLDSIGELKIGNKLFENIYIIKECDDISDTSKRIEAYCNVKNGIIRYVTHNDNDTFDLYKYIPKNK